MSQRHGVQSILSPSRGRAWLLSCPRAPSLDRIPTIFPWGTFPCWLWFISPLRWDRKVGGSWCRAQYPSAGMGFQNCRLERSSQPPPLPPPRLGSERVSWGPYTPRPTRSVAGKTVVTHLDLASRGFSVSHWPHSGSSNSPKLPWKCSYQLLYTTSIWWPGNQISKWKRSISTLSRFLGIVTLGVPTSKLFRGQSWCYKISLLWC